MNIKHRDMPDQLPRLPGVSSLLQRIYAARDVQDESQLDKRLQALLPFNTLTDIDKACVRLEQALRAQQRILIVGDFDADGATSSALAVAALRAMGALHVEFLVPNRFEFGYGLTPGIINVAKEWRPDLIITVDNGIASIEGVDAANDAGIDVLVTDHHLPGDTLPKACAIVNPNQVGCLFPSKAIAGVGVIFYVMLGLRRHLMGTDWFTSQNSTAPNMAQFLDLVALGTVADVVPLDQNNRIMVHQGLERIRQGLCRPGIQALMTVASRQREKLRESDLGFAIAPRLNAAGRLDDMSLGIDCLLSDSLQVATELAGQLDALNVERRQIESEMSEQAMLALSQFTIHATENSMPVALCLMDKTWHQGVIGILAGRLKERYHRPVIAFAKADETELKGSARSIPGLNIRDVLAAIDTEHPGLIKKFGGHAMAAGLALHPDDFAAFKTALVTEVSKHLDESQCKGLLLSDGSLPADALSLNVATELQRAGPWGQQFPEPLFDDTFEVLEQRIVGKNHLKLTLVRAFGGPPLDAIAFNIDLNAWPNHRARYLHAAYKLDINEYNGRTRLQLLVSAMRVSAEDGSLL